jgi:hypothetical protein
MTKKKIETFLFWLVSRNPETYGNKYFRKQIKHYDENIRSQHAEV